MMPAIVSPIHIEAIGLHNVRFFRSPLTGPRQPWHAIDDLFAAMTISRGLRRAIKADMPKSEWGKAMVQVQTADGPLDIAAHFIAQAAIGLAQERFNLPKDFEISYTEAVAKAMKVITAGMSDLEAVNYTIAAYRNENGIEGPFNPLTEADVIRKPLRRH
jgi:hypothetical protein